MTLKLWLISQRQNTDYDTFDSAVVCAATEDDARRIHPASDNGPGSEDVWNWRGSSWCDSPDAVTVKALGDAAPDIAPGVVLASFNAG